MSETPERIWAFAPDIFDNLSVWQDAPSPAGDTIEYVRVDMLQQIFDRYSKAEADRIEELEAELHLLKTSGIAEVAVRNQNVMEYMRHWEGRAEAAEAELEKQLKIAAANEESEGAASFRVSRFMYEMTGGKDE